MDNGGTLKITVERRDMPGALLDMSIADNRILAVFSIIAIYIFIEKIFSY